LSQIRPDVVTSVVFSCLLQITIHVRNEDDDNFYVDRYLFYPNLWWTSRRRANLYNLEDKNVI